MPSLALRDKVIGREQIAGFEIDPSSGERPRFAYPRCRYNKLGQTFPPASFAGVRQPNGCIEGSGWAHSPALMRRRADKATAQPNPAAGGLS